MTDARPSEAAKTWAQSVADTLTSGGELPRSWERIPTRSPAVLDATGARTLLTIPLAAIVIGALVVTARGSPLDPLALFLRILAYGFGLRALLAVVVLGRRVSLAMGRSRHALAVGPEGIVLRGPSGTSSFERKEVLAVLERGDWRQRGGSRRFASVYVVAQPVNGEPRFMELLPVFEDSPGILAERLMRWHGAQPEHREPPAVDPDELGSRIYDEAASGARSRGMTVVRNGRGWLVRGPYATLLLAVALLDSVLRMSGLARAALGWTPLVWLVVAFGAVPLGWLWVVRRELRPRKGLALVMTPAEMLVRTRRRLVRVAWRDVTNVYLDSRASWSILRGQHAQWQVVFDREGRDPLRYDEAFLGVPAEVVQALADAYRRGRIDPP